VLAEFEGLDILLVDSEPLVQRAYDQARRRQQSQLFDAVYLACADDLDADLWTCDARFVRSVRG
jgi:predicted nucleic acid-binding protein